MFKTFVEAAGYKMIDNDNINDDNKEEHNHRAETFDVDISKEMDHMKDF